MSEHSPESLDLHSESAQVAARVEGRWATIAVIIVIFLAGMAAFAGIHQATMPQARVETIDPKTLHLGGEFVETNLGSAMEPDGTVTVRGLAQQYSFNPACILVPTDTPVVLRVTSPDVIHGFLIEGTSVNTMVVPGYIASLPTKFDKPGERLMPCHEFCGVGHEGMWGRVKVVDKAEFSRMSSGNRRLNCVD